MTEWEHEIEKEEFSKAAKLYKPLAAAMASRFTKAKFQDDAVSVELPEDVTVSFIFSHRHLAPGYFFQVRNARITFQRLF